MGVSRMIKLPGLEVSLLYVTKISVVILILFQIIIIDLCVEKYVLQNVSKQLLIIYRLPLNSYSLNSAN